MPPDGVDLFDYDIQSANPDGTPRTRIVRHRFVFFESITDMFLGIYLVYPDGSNKLICQEDLSKREYLGRLIDWRGVERTINTFFAYAISERITDLNRLSERFLTVEYISPEIANALAACTREVVLELSEAVERVVSWVNPPTQAYYRDMELVIAMKNDVRPLRPLSFDPNANLVESELIPFSGEDLDILLFEGA